MRTTELILPTWMASALINGDSSGLNDEEDEMVEELLEWVADNNIGYCVDVSEESDFYNKPPIDSVLSYGETLGGDYSIYTFLYNG